MKRAYDESLKEAPQQQTDDSEEGKVAGRRGSGSGGDEEEEYTPEQLSRMTRSERKRHREKKRRNDVNKGFEDLMNLLLEIDPVVRAEAEDRARRGQLRGNPGTQEENLLSRVDLINRTVEVLRKVHTENEDRKLIIEHLLRSRSQVPSDVRDSDTLGAANAPQLARALSGEGGASTGPQVAVPVPSSLLFPPAARPSGQLADGSSARFGPSVPTAGVPLTDPSLRDVLLQPSNLPGRGPTNLGVGVGASSQQFSPSSLLSTNSLIQQQMLDSSFENQRNQLGAFNAQPSVVNQLLMRRQLQGPDAIAPAAAMSAAASAPPPPLPPPPAAAAQAAASRSELIGYLLRRSREGGDGNQQQQQGQGQAPPPGGFPF